VFALPHCRVAEVTCTLMLTRGVVTAYTCVLHACMQVAILWEGDEAKDIRRITYKDLLREVCKVSTRPSSTHRLLSFSSARITAYPLLHVQLANGLKALGVNKGDPVVIYMPMVPEAAVAMLACARLGAPHSVVFAGFSAESLRDRIQDCQAKIVITADEV